MLPNCRCLPFRKFVVSKHDLLPLSPIRKPRYVGVATWISLRTEDSKRQLPLHLHRALLSNIRSAVTSLFVLLFLIETEVNRGH